MEAIKIKDNLIATVLNRTLTQVEVTFGGKTNYLVWSNGRVFSTTYYGTDRKYEISRTTNKDGYASVTLSTKGGFRHVMLHRLIAYCFIPNPSNKPQINHVDENKLNNCVENLEWVTAKENCNHGTCIARRDAKNTNGKKSMPIKQLTLDGELVRIWPSIHEAGRNGFKYPNIGRVCRKEYGRNTYKGFRWEYCDPSHVPAHRNNAASQYNSENSKRVDQYTLDGMLIKTWPSVAETGRNGFAKNSIAQCCRGNRINYAGYIWRYEGDSFDKHMTTHKIQGKKTYQYSLDGELVAEWPSALIASQQTGISYKAIIRDCRGECKSNVAGYRWRYSTPSESENDSIVRQKTGNTETK